MATEIILNCSGELLRNDRNKFINNKFYKII